MLSQRWPDWSAPGAIGAQLTCATVPRSYADPNARPHRLRRLQSELMSLMMSGETSLSAFPDGDNIFQWTGTIAGGDGTVRGP